MTQEKELIDTYFASKEAVHRNFGYVGEWTEIPLEDYRHYYWYIHESGDRVCYAVTVDELINGDHYSRYVYTPPFLPKYIYRTDKHTMISVEFHNIGSYTDGDKYLNIFDNSKEVKP